MLDHLLKSPNTAWGLWISSNGRVLFIPLLSIWFLFEFVIQERKLFFISWLVGVCDFCNLYCHLKNKRIYIMENSSKSPKSSWRLVNFITCLCCFFFTSFVDLCLDLSDSQKRKVVVWADWWTFVISLLYIVT